MPGGPLPYPKRRINPAFRDLVRVVLRDRMTATPLAAMLGIPQQSGLSVLLNQPFTATPLAVARLQKLATIAGFSGDLFAREESAPELQEQTREAVSR